MCSQFWEVHILEQNSEVRGRSLVVSGFVLLGIGLGLLIPLFLARASQEKKSKAQDELELDHDLEETFPASDPVGHY
jgi:hypothetical protein